MANFRFFLYSIALLGFFLLSYQFNFFYASSDDFFKNHQIDSESLVIGKIIQSEEGNYFSEGGFIGHVVPYDGNFSNNNDIVNYQYSTFLSDKNMSVGFNPYMQSSGLQGYLYTKIVKILDKFNVKSNIDKLFIMKLITVFFTSLLLVVFINFVLKEFGAFTSFFTFLFLLFSQWLVVFSHNLYWVFFLLLLPFIIVLVCYHKNEDPKRVNFVSCFFVFMAILIKSLAGYEYISTILISIIVPILYFAIKNEWGIKRFLNHSIFIGVSGLLGFASALTLHIIQLKFYLLSWQAAIVHVSSTIAKRTYGDPSKLPEVYRESLEGNLLTVFKFYSKSKLFDLTPLVGFNFQIRFFMILILLIFITRFVLKKIRQNDSDFLRERRAQITALVYTTWFSILAPISWYILAKGHSYVHTSINHVLWYLPFLLLGFTLISFCINYKVNDYVLKRVNRY